MISDPLGSRGIQFYFEDSGPPVETNVYSTLVILHGTSYHSSIFHRLVPLAAAHNLRMVLVNRRDYPGTTFTTPEEIDKIRSTRKDDQAEITRDMGVELAAFFAWWVRGSRIPPVGEDGVAGGMTVLAWSAGNATGLSMIAHLDLLFDQDKDIFRDYLRAFILYDSPSYLFGYPMIPEIYHPLRDLSIPDLQDRIKLFNVWITSYYHHPDLGARSLSGLAQHPIEDPLPEKRPTLYRLTQGELESLTFPDALTRAEGHIRFVSPEVYGDNTRKIWFDEGHAKLFPRLRMKLIWCKESILDTPYGAWKMEADIDAFVGKGGKGRALEIHCMEGNHFAHWDRPAETMQFFADLV